MNRKEIIEDVIGHYNADNRSVSSGSDASGLSDCLYVGPAGACCAFSRFVKPEHRSALIEDENASHQLECFGSAILRDDIDPDVKADPLFWNELQNLHDVSRYWDHEGLSPAGRSEADNLLKKCES
jgi:hypothetical protein